MDALQIFDTIKQFDTMQQIIDWATSVGYDFDPDYSDYDDDIEHPNYQQFFVLNILIGEIGEIKNGTYTIFYSDDDDELLAQHESDNQYNDLFDSYQTHAVTAVV